MKLLLNSNLDIRFERLYTDYYPKLTAYASFFLTEEEAHDIVQDIFLKLFEDGIYRRMEGVALNAYLYRAVQNRCIDVARHQTIKNQYRNLVGERFMRLEAQYFYSSRNEIEDGLLSAELQKQIDDGIDSLPPKRKLVFKLYVKKGKKVKEISALLGISVSTVENHIYACTKALRVKLAKYLLVLYVVLLLCIEICF